MVNNVFAGKSKPAAPVDALVMVIAMDELVVVVVVVGNFNY